MRSLNGLADMDPEFLYATLSMYRGDLAANIFPVSGSQKTSGPKAIAYATKTCTSIVLILARISYSPEKIRPPQRLSIIGAAWSKSRS